MALNDYDGLKTEIAENIARSDIAASSSRIETAISLAEAEFNQRLRHRKMEKEMSITSSNGRANLPSDFLQLISITNPGDPKGLEYRSRSQFFELGNTNSGSARYFTIVNVNDTTDAVAVDHDGTFNLTYYGSLASLSSSNTTNWLLMRYPEAYLDAALYFLFRRLRNALAADYKGLMDAAIENLNSESEKTTSGAPTRTVPNMTVV